MLWRHIDTHFTTQESRTLPPPPHHGLRITKLRSRHSRSSRCESGHPEQSTPVCSCFPRLAAPPPTTSPPCPPQPAAAATAAAASRRPTWLAQLHCRPAAGGGGAAWGRPDDPPTTDRPACQRGSSPETDFPERSDELDRSLARLPP